MTHFKGAAKEAARAMNLMKKRQQEQEELELRKKNIEEKLAVGSIDNKFATHYDAIEERLKTNTIGLVTLDQMKARQEDVIKLRENQLAKGDSASRLNDRNRKERKLNRKEKKKTLLSFDMDEDEEEDQSEDDKADTYDEDTDEEPEMKKKRLGKNPTVDTSFLPDRDREEEDNRIRLTLREEWAGKQNEIKNQEITIVYSYWDGSGHRRSVKMKKGNSVQQFLQKCLDTCRKDFNELKRSTVDQLIYVKEDLIIPHHNTFYDFIVTKARGKSGPLFSFDVHDDVRFINDATVEKNESHAGKVCLRSWYERHKHIFPASRWEPYDPEKSWDKYTVSDKEAAKITVK